MLHNPDQLISAGMTLFRSLRYSPRLSSLMVTVQNYFWTLNTTYYALLSKRLIMPSSQSDLLCPPNMPSAALQRKKSNSFFYRPSLDEAARNMGWSVKATARVIFAASLPLVILLQQLPLLHPAAAEADAQLTTREKSPPPETDECWIFTHLQKCGGSTVKGILSETWGPR